ncbi:MAG: accessory Sec system translocase SecA2 [Acidobacteria bacterium]|nr:accessory Sec system translocase SecA2 [Acidobacteriota bacterium]
MSSQTTDPRPTRPGRALAHLLTWMAAALRGEEPGEVATEFTSYYETAARVSARDLRQLTDEQLRRRSRHFARHVQAVLAAATKHPHGPPAATAGRPEADPTADLVSRAAVPAFALVREAARRTLGLEPFEVQIVAGLAMAQHHIVEMPTGEGKTLAAVFPVYLHALAGYGVHVLTFNDYLARRDAAWMGPIYRLLGLSVGCVQEGMSVAERRAAYRCDLTYLTAKEAGFDLLRDSLCLQPEEQVHRPLHLAVIDEADSILIDEARIPLVIAGSSEEDHDTLPRLAALARRLVPGEDFDTDQARRNVFLTDEGIARVERALACENLFAPPSLSLQAAVRNALHAEHLLSRDVDYIVRAGAIELVDEITGRVAERRHWPNGLQAAVEAKEGVHLGAGGTILGSITIQHLMRQYPHLAGMTATAASAAAELWDVYGLPAMVVPPNRPCRRVDEPDRIFTCRAARDAALAEEIAREHASGRPVLVGTASVAESERLAAALQSRNIACQVLNAKHDAREAEIVADAGDLGAVTISTNMAGRGTDIRLGGRHERHRDGVTDLGGLLVLGTHRHPSLRVDRQLRGRAGRQGDPGASRFFLSLDDEMLTAAGIGDLIPAGLVATDVDRPLEIPLIQREVARAQRIIEGEHASARRRLYAYADAIETRRREIAAWRQEVLDGRSVGDLLEERCRQRWERLRPVVGEAVLRGVEQRLTLLAIDRCWADYLGEMQSLRDEIHLVSLDGREPLVEFTRAAGRAYGQMLDRIDDTIAEGFEALDITPAGVDWAGCDLRRPAATWTYMISDTEFRPNVLRSLANHATFGLWAALLLAPLLFIWGLYEHWRRRRSRNAAACPNGSRGPAASGAIEAGNGEQ